jgi:hypothetical protein
MVIISMQLQSTAGLARLVVEDRHRMRNWLLVLANGLQETARIRNSSIDAFPPIYGEPTLSTGQCVSVAFSRTAVMGAWSEAINALPVL